MAQPAYSMFASFAAAINSDPVRGQLRKGDTFSTSFVVEAYLNVGL